MDLMQVIDQIGREKGIEKGILIDAVGAAILSASRKSLPAAQAALDLRVDFDGKTGQFMLYAVRKVVAVTAPLCSSTVLSPSVVP